MTDVTREEQRAELRKAIWRIANELRGSVDGWDFKQYVLTTLFYRYISEDLERFVNDWEVREGDIGFDYATMDDADAEAARVTIVNARGYFMLPSQLFKNICKKAATDKNLNETIEKTFHAIEASSVGSYAEKDFKGLFADFDPNSTRLGATVDERNRRLVAILKGVQSMALGSIRDNKIDAFGDAYEYLMTMYAAGAGKSGGEFFTPQEVSRLLALLATEDVDSINKVYDPCCGSAGLLLQAAKVLGDDRVRQGYFGQEINPTTFNLARINMFLHGIAPDKFDIARGDTLLNPLHWDFEPFDMIVSNPPYSISWSGPDNAATINDPRFAPAGVLAPKDKADWAFILHMLAWLSEKGTAAIVVYPGILSRGQAEQKIRKFVIDNNYVDAVIQLPINLFFGATIQTCILVLKKNKPDTSVLFVNAETCFTHEGDKNRLQERHIQQVVEWYRNRSDINYRCKVADVSDIAALNYTLLPGRYVDDLFDSDCIDIETINGQLELLHEKQTDVRARIDSLLNGFSDSSPSAIIDHLLKETGSTVIREQLGEMLAYEQPGPYIVKSTEYDDSYATPVLTAGKGFVLGHTNETEGIYTASPDNPVIIFDDFTTSFHWVDFDFKVKSSAMKMLRPKSGYERNFRYIYYAMQCIKYRPATHARQWISIYSKLTIPLYPEPIRDRIVDALDTFNELENLLEQELTSRRGQYKHYLNEFFSADEERG